MFYYLRWMYAEDKINIFGSKFWSKYFWDYRFKNMIQRNNFKKSNYEKSLWISLQDGTKPYSWYFTQANSAGLKNPWCPRQSKLSFDKNVLLILLWNSFFQYIKNNQDFTCKYTITFYHATSFWSLRNEAWALTPVLRWGCSKWENRASDYLLSPIGWMFLLMNLAWPTWSICSLAFVFSRHLFDSWTSLWSFATKSLDIASSFCIFAIWPSLWMALSLASCKEASSSWIFC